MFESEERFGFTVTFLLFQKRAQSEAPMMPDNRGGTKGNDEAGLLQAPAKIDIVPGSMILGVEAADLFEGPTVKRHVTTGNVLGHGVGQQNVTRSTGRGGHTRLNRVLRRRTHIRPADSGVIAA